MHPTPTLSTLLLIQSDHPGWRAMRVALAARSDVRVIEEEAGAAVATTGAPHPDVIIVAADIATWPLVALVDALRAIHPTSKIIVVGPHTALLGDTLLDLEALGLPRPSCLLWEEVRPEAVLDCLPVVIDDGLLVGSPAALDILLAALDRRRGPRVDGLLLTHPERAQVAAPPTRQATLWTEDADLIACLRFLGARAGLAVEAVGTAAALLDVLGHMDDTLVIVDCLAPTTALARAATVVTRTERPVYIVHADQEFVADLGVRARGPVLWLPPQLVGLTLLTKLRLWVDVPLAPAVHDATTATRPTPLSAREQEVYGLVAVGLTNWQIGARLHVGRSTVATDVARIKRKLDLDTRTDLIAAYHQQRGVETVAR